jgi:molybdopterin-guanine dinucleotide biosynthesis protein A
MGRNKAFLRLEGRPLIAIVADRLCQVAREVIIAADDTKLYAPFADRAVPDLIPGVGTLGGIHAGLSAARNPLAIVVGCDMPFLNPAVLAWFVGAVGEADLAILKNGEHFEPLHAVYRKSCLPAITALIRGGERRAYRLHEQVRVRYVAPNEISHIDPELASFRNINTPAQWRRTLGNATKNRMSGFGR